MHPSVAAALWGLLGGLVVEAYDNVDEMRRTGCLPWKRRVGRKQIGLAVWLFALLLRVGAGAVVAAVAAAGGVFSGPLGSFAVGVGGPLALESIMRRIPLSAGAPDPADGRVRTPPRQRTIPRNRAESPEPGAVAGLAISAGSDGADSKVRESDAAVEGAFGEG
jgi:hypothetical protein